MWIKQKSEPALAGQGWPCRCQMESDVAPATCFQPTQLHMAQKPTAAQKTSAFIRMYLSTRCTSCISWFRNWLKMDDPGTLLGFFCCSALQCCWSLTTKFWTIMWFVRRGYLLFTKQPCSQERSLERPSCCSQPVEFRRRPKIQLAAYAMVLIVIKLGQGSSMSPVPSSFLCFHHGAHWPWLFSG